MFAGSEWVDYDEDDGLAGPVVRRLAIDSQNNVWVATSTGISKIGGFTSSAFDIDLKKELASIRDLLDRN